MLKLYKNKGISLIELLVSMGLGLVLVFSMLAYYSISQQNVTDYAAFNREQQNLRKMMNQLSKDIENTGAFECAKHTDIFGDSDGFDRFPQNIIAIGANRERKQIMFVHPITEEHLYKSLGMIDIKQDASGIIANYDPIEIEAGCGQEVNSTIYIGSTLFEVIHVKNDYQIITSLNNPADNKAINDSIKAFVVLSYIQSRQEKNTTTKAYLQEFNREYFDDNNKRVAPSNGNTESFSTAFKNNAISPIYRPSIEDATVMMLSNESDDADQKTLLPFGKNTVEIFLGFSTDQEDGYVPQKEMGDLKDGGWINPFASDTNYNKLVDKDKTSVNEAKLLNIALHKNPDSDDEIYPLSETAAKQVRAVKFQFTFNDGDVDTQYRITRTIRLKSAHLKSLDQR